ncbi:DUF2142 domain-containing protein [Ruminococcaceae bacterium OttesenSCG-928-N02]|nr:DUF2142 domain-containing protein [Ruminococcaceae bacterium OttesenSCG-928-N02]
MPNLTQKLKKAPLPLLAWGLAYLVLCIGVLTLTYYWRVFYAFNRWGAGTLFFGVWCVATALYIGVFAIAHFLKGFNVKATAAIFLCGLLFCFANPPLQTPDETNHFLRAYAISMGRFDFDAERTYPKDVDLMMSSFRAAWANYHGGAPVKIYYHLQDPEDENSAKIEDRFVSIASAFTTYRQGLQEIAEGGTPATKTAHEPLIVMILPYLPQAFAMFIARLFGFSALGCFYAGRVANLLLYTALCYLALCNCKRYKPVFLAFMLMPLGLFLGASISYDALLLGLYYLLASFYCKDEITMQDMAVFTAAFVLVNAVKPWINLLWLALPLVLPKEVWKDKHKKWVRAIICVALALLATAAVEWYGTTFRYNYGDVGRMLPDVVPVEQLAFIFKNIPRFLAVCLGTLYENGIFLGQLGLFGALDVNIPLVNILTPVVLMLCTLLSVHERSSLKAKPALGLFGLSVAYIGATLVALYITYTPVGMVRVLGLQARYFLPPFLLLFILLAALLSNVLAPAPARDEKAWSTALWVCVGFAVFTGALLFQHYYIGPVLEVLVPLA